LLAPLQNRVSRLESEFESLANLVGRLTEQSVSENQPPRASEVIKAVASRVNDIRKCFGEAFGGIIPTVAVLPPAQGSDYSAVVQLDVSAADKEVIARAREEGARPLFYRSLMDCLPTDVLDAIDFEFVFP